MGFGRRVKDLVLCLGLIALLAACAAPPSSPGSTSGGREARADQQSPSVGPKTLTIGLQRGMPEFSGYTGFSTSTSASNIRYMVNDGVTYQDNHGVFYPLMAVELPSIEKGTWRIFDDGTMETTWRIRPNIKWHDGRPLTSEDFSFGFTVEKDRELPKNPTPAIQARSAIATPDPHTIVISWATLFVDAGTDAPAALPRHVLQETYQRDKQAFINAPHWTTEYVGTGPYKILQYDPGADMELGRFDDYYLGRPPFDKVFIRVIGDSNALVSSILAGAVDIVLPPGVELEAALEVKRRWEGTGNEVRADVNGRIIHFEVQFRPEVAQPTRGFRERAVRQALYQAVDRQALADYMTGGLGPLADSWYRPSDPIRPQLNIPQYPHDPGAAPGLLGSVGWRKGPDGLLVHDQSGEQFKTAIYANQPAGWDRLASVVANDWKPLGVQIDVVPIPPARIGDREYESGYSGLFVTNVNEEQFYVNRLHSRFKTSAETRWTGNNRGGYDNPRVDALYEQLTSTIDPQARIPVQRELVREVMGELVMLPFYWETLPVLKLKGVKDHPVRTGYSTWFFFNWNKE